MSGAAQKDFAERLRALGLSKRAFARLIAVLSGSDGVKYRTVEDWGRVVDPPDAAIALIALLETIAEFNVVAVSIGKGLVLELPRRTNCIE